MFLWFLSILKCLVIYSTFQINFGVEIACLGGLCWCHILLVNPPLGDARGGRGWVKSDFGWNHFNSVELDCIRFDSCLATFNLL